MQVRWVSADLSQGLGHGVEFHLLHTGNGPPHGFISGYGWREDKGSEVVAYLDARLGDMPPSMTAELRLAMLLFLTDKKRQKNEVAIHGFVAHFNP